MCETYVTLSWNGQKSNYLELTVLVFILLYFSYFASFVATSLKTGIMPDELTHFNFVIYFSQTWGIPRDTLEVIRYGVFMQPNPYLYYWIMGRVTNFIHIFNPSLAGFELLSSLRLVNVVFSLGTLVTTYFISKEVIKRPYWPILPVFMLANTLMYVFLSGGVNYDNLTNLLAALAALFLVRYLYRDKFSDLLLSLLFLLAGSLTKLSFIPLAVVTFLLLLYLFIKRGAKFPGLNFGYYALIILVVLFSVLNARLHINNLLTYQKIKPTCEDIFTQRECEVSPFVIREKRQGLEEKLGILEAVRKGYPEPIRYTFDTWSRIMLSRIYGILGHVGYFPTITAYFHLYLYVMAVIGFKYLPREESVYSLLLLIATFALSIMAVNYNYELVFGFKHISLQGRYLFPIWNLVYVLIAYAVSKVGKKWLLASLVALTLVLFFMGGPLKFVTHYASVFADWMQ